MGRDVLELNHPQELKLFKEKVLNKISSFYEDTKDIKLAVHETVSDLEARYELSGWVQGNDIPDVAPLYSEITQLKDKNKELIELLEQQTKTVKNTPASTSKDEFDELIVIFEKIEIDTYLDPETDEPKKYDLLTLLTNFKERMIVGVTNRAGTRDDIISQLLFFNVCPKLQIYGIVINEKVPSVQYRRFSLTKKGEKFLAYIEKKEILK